jgi:hypothetical protein
MKRVYYLIIVFLLVSCDQVIFPEPQPARSKAMKAIPSSLQGKWLDHNGDTLYISESLFNYRSDDFAIGESEQLSDSTVLKEYKGKYFYSRRVAVGGEKYWISYILYPVKEACQIDLYAMDPGDIVKLAKLQEITTKIKDVEEGELNYYLFAPKRRHYKTIIADTIFTKMISFTKIEDQ